MASLDGTDAGGQRPVVTRFAPSPTGFLHIGNARTGLFSWLYARHFGGKALLRIEDTDKARSTQEAIDVIHDGLAWLGLEFDGEPTYQSERAGRHAEVAQKLLDAGKAYKCFATPEELAEMREQQRAAKQPMRYDGRWRDRDASEAPEGAPFTIRIKTPEGGETVIEDAVQGRVKVDNREVDDFILLRADGTPTYMLAVVVDDHDMGVTHVIRGDDHLINAGRQSLIYQAMGWDVPEFAHIPLIHGEDGKKLSKRHGATGLEEYAAMGYLPAAMRNYLARLGWSHGNDELFTTEQAIEWFDFDGMGKSPSRLDFKKLDNVSAHHIKIADDDALMDGLLSYSNEIGRDLSEAQKSDLKRALPILREKSKKLGDVLDKAAFILTARPIALDEKSQEIINSVSNGILKRLTTQLENDSWTQEDLMNVAKQFADIEGMKLGEVAAPIRAALCGRSVSPSVFDMMVLLGRDETLARLNDQIS